jgi:hypothetical protein
MSFVSIMKSTCQFEIRTNESIESLTQELSKSSGVCLNEGKTTNENDSCNF